MPKFRSISKEVEAEQFFSDKSLPFHDRRPVVCYEFPAFYVETIHGERATLTNGDWVILEPDSDFQAYPCKPDIFKTTYELADAPQKPIDMVLYCPKCNLRHIDGPEPDVCESCGHRKDHHLIDIPFGCKCLLECGCEEFKAWENPPHKSHRCKGCNTVFRVADVPTNGVKAINSKGENDTWFPPA